MTEKLNNNIIAVLAFIILIIIITAISDRHYAYSRDLKLKKEIKTEISATELELKINTINRFDSIIAKLNKLNKFNENKTNH